MLCPAVAALICLEHVQVEGVIGRCSPNLFLYKNRTLTIGLEPRKRCEH